MTSWQLPDCWFYKNYVWHDSKTRQDKKLKAYEFAPILADINLYFTTFNIGLNNYQLFLQKKLSTYHNYPDLDISVIVVAVAYIVVATIVAEHLLRHLLSY